MIHYKSFRWLFGDVPPASKPPKEIVGKQDHHKGINWNKNHLVVLRGILDRLATLMDESGAIKYSTKPNAGHGPYQTLESLLPFVLFPEKENFHDAIVQMAAYVISQADVMDGGFRPFPEYPYWEFSAVDSTAYAIHVFAQLRDYLHAHKETKTDLEPLANKVDLAIQKSIGFISRNINNDDGWGFVKNEEHDLNSRTYSTSLVVNALSHCLDTDFPKEISKKTLIGKGVGYLIARQCKEGEVTGGWFFSTDDKRVHPNITSVVVYSLSQTYKYNRDRRVEDAIEKGIRYITKYWTMDDVVERVKYPSSTGTKKIEFHEFVHPHQMILPAALLSGEVGFNDDRIREIAQEIINNYKQKIDRFEEEPLDPDSTLNAWDLAETAFTLSTYYSVCDVVEHSDTLFATTNMYHQIFHETQVLMKILRIQNDANLQKIRSSRFWLGFFGFLAFLGTSLSIYVTINPEFAVVLNKQFGSFLLGLLSLVVIPIVVNMIYDLIKERLKNK